MRLFFAVDTPISIKKQMEKIQLQLIETDADVKWEPKEKFHITIKFLGETKENLIPQLEKYLNSIGETYPPFQLVYKNLGCFPNVNRPRVVWIGTELKDDILIKIKDYLDENLKQFGFEIEDRKFTPHITLGRVKSMKNIKNLISIIENLKFESEPVFCGEIILMESILKPTGSEYKVIRSVNLKGKNL